MFSYKIFKTPNDTLVAVCDKDILGKKFENDVVFEVSENFYGGDDCGEDELREILKNATIINAIGNKTIDFLVKEKLVNKKGIIKIGDVSHAQIVTV